MKNNLFFIMLFLPFTVFAAPDSLKKATDTSKKVADPIPTLKREVFMKVITSTFSNILTGSSKSQVGDFASFNPAKSAATFNYSIITKDATVFSFNVTADSKNGLASVFNNTMLNTDVSLEAKVSFLSYSRKKAVLNAPDPWNQVAFDLRGTVLPFDHSLDSLRADSSLKMSTMTNAVELGRLRYVRLLKEVDSLQKLGQSLTLLARRDSLNHLLLNYAAVYQADLSKTWNSDGSSNVKQMAAYQKAYGKKLGKALKQVSDALTDNLKPAGYELSWWDIDYKVNNSSFSLFDPTMPYASQVNKTNFIMHQVSVDFNRYHYAKLDNSLVYFSAGADLFLGDNLSLFKTVNMEDIKSYTSGTQVRNVTKTYTAYLDSSKYRRDLLGMKLHADLFYFIFKNHMASIHVFPAASFSQQLTPEYDAGLGLLLSFKSKKDTTGKALINTELYCNFLDLSDSLHKTGSFYDRNDIGIRFVFPINFTHP